jgi:hypothetical protein
MAMVPADGAFNSSAEVAYTGGATMSYTDNGAAGDPYESHYWGVTGANACSAVAAPAARSGEFDFGLVK